jgi:hypothetical protein
MPSTVHSSVRSVLALIVATVVNPVTVQSSVPVVGSRISASVELPPGVYATVGGPITAAITATVTVGPAPIALSGGAGAGANAGAHGILSIETFVYRGEWSSGTTYLAREVVHAEAPDESGSESGGDTTSPEIVASFTVPAGATGFRFTGKRA